MICRVGVGFLAYIVIGATVLKFHLGMKGMEVIPHAHFWMDLPNLIKVSITSLLANPSING